MRALVTLLLFAACGDATQPLVPGPKVTALWTSPTFPGCIWASPLAISSRGDRFLLAASGDGTIAALDEATGQIAWQVALPAPDGMEPYLLATPVVVGSNLFVAYQQRDAASKIRQHHVVLAVDLEARALNPAFSALELTATEGTISFNPATQASRAALVHGAPPGATLGRLYVSYGNIQDIQPWHGWLFELDLDAWPKIAATLLTTSLDDCGPSGESGSRDHRCGGGIWAPSGPALLPQASGYELIVPTGNGHLDLAAGDYANALLRTGPGLTFDPGCDAAACALFDGLDPARGCLDSCRDLFVPRLLPDDPPLRPESGVCDGATLLECYAALDWDLGADTPTLVESADALALPGKDGAVYLIDHEHLGTLLDRRQISAPCGTQSDACSTDWAGMMVTQPLVIGDDVIVPTFEFDRTHPAGVVALRVEGRRLKPRWTAPDFQGSEARAQFRRHPSRPIAVTLGGEIYVFLVDVQGRSGRGLLYGMRERDGALVARVQLSGAGMRYIKPVEEDGALFVTSCAADAGPGTVEAFRLAP